MDSELEVIFAQKQLRLTAPRKAVFDLMKSADTPVSIAQIAEDCKTIDRVSVYRTIELFQELGIVKAVPLGWKQLYELTSPFKAHHHHLSCTRCGRLIDVHSHKFEILVASIAKDYKFTPQDHTFEIKGLCETCANSSVDASR